VERRDVLIVGGGPAGSSCALGLAGSGLSVVVWDRARFPRDKVCAGWITPQIVREVGLDLEAYAAANVLQPIVGFRFGRMGDREVVVRYDEPVSYGIRRRELDAWLLERAGAELRLGEPVDSLEPGPDGFTVNGTLTAAVVVGAGGHFCPVARRIVGKIDESPVVAREIEFEMTPEQAAACPVDAAIPELYFTRDLRGYGWVFRKEHVLNVGLGRQDPNGFPAHVEAFVDWLEQHERLPPGTSRKMRGHAYLLYGANPRPPVAERALLVGDAAGLAYPQSGEGIRPAVESGLLAARVLRDAGGRYDAATLGEYARQLAARFGPRRARPGGITDWIPERWRGPIAGHVLSTPWFARHVVMDRWFLHRHDAPLTC
jgi:geranylgeranyl reductase family protein